MLEKRQNPLELMRFGIDYKFKVRLHKFEIIFRPLSVLETTQIADETRDFILTLKPEHQTDIKYSAVFANKTLQRASTSEPGKSDFQISELVLTHCTPDEVMFLFNEYNKCVDKVNPNIETMTTEVLNKLVDDAKKNLLIMTELSFWQMENLCRALIKETIQLGKSSGGLSTTLSTEP